MIIDNERGEKGSIDEEKNAELNWKHETCVTGKNLQQQVNARILNTQY